MDGWMAKNNDMITAMSPSILMGARQWGDWRDGQWDINRGLALDQYDGIYSSNTLLRE